MTTADKPIAATPLGFSARRPLVAGFLTLAALGVGLFGWGAATTITGAVIATGQVDVETRDQVVEHIDGGTVDEILVRDGDRVAAGDVLIRLDDAALRSEEAILRGERVELMAWGNRLEAEFRAVDAIAWDAELAESARTDAATRGVIDGQQRLFEARHSSWAGQVAQFRERIGQTRKQIGGLKAQGDAVTRQRAFVGRELDAQRQLFEKGLTGFHRLLELEREAARLDGEAGDIAARIAGARGRISEIEIAVLQIGTRRVEEAEGQVREVQAREKKVRERLVEVRRRLAGMEIRAPASGEVYGMRVFTLGEVVRPGEPILNIVPEDSELVVRAQLEPIHVDQVHLGQEAVLRFSAFPARNTPEFEGRIRQVSADTVHDQRTGLSWYEVEVEMGRAMEPEEGLAIVTWASSVYHSVAGWVLGGSPGAPDDPREGTGIQPEPPVPTALIGDVRRLALSPGMPVEVRIRTGERTPLSYLVKPLTDYFGRSLREE